MSCWITFANFGAPGWAAMNKVWDPAGSKHPEEYSPWKETKL
jgi:hypothetical protein